MIRTLSHIAVWALLACLAACGEEPGETPAPSSDDIIRWAASIDGATDTRALIGPSNQPDENKPIEGDDETHPDGSSYKTLAEACKPEEEGGLGRKIALWGDYQRDETAEYVNLFQNISLYYRTQGSNPYSGWNYAGNAVYWDMGSTYIFRAYYPSEITPLYNSNASNFAITNHDTNLNQEDLLVAFNKICTTDKITVDGKEELVTSRPVALKFHHALAALKFVFRMGFEYDDALTACWFENDSDLVGIAPAGDLSYSGTHPDSQTVVSDITTAVFDNEGQYESARATQYLVWYKGAALQTGYSTYEWRSEGVPFKSEYKTSADGQTRELEYTTTATAYTDHEVTAGQLFTDNGGWLLIPPQAMTGHAQLCFTTSKAGDIVTRVTLPAKISYTDPETSQTVETDKWEAGKRYAYTVTLNKSDVELELSVAPWNERRSSHQIIF